MRVMQSNLECDEDEMEVKDELGSPLLSNVDNEWLFLDDIIVKEETVQNQANDESTEFIKDYKPEDVDDHSSYTVTSKSTPNNTPRCKTPNKNETSDDSDSVNNNKKDASQHKKSCVSDEVSKAELQKDVEVHPCKRVRIEKVPTIELYIPRTRSTLTPEERKEKRRLTQLKRRHSMSQEQRQLHLAQQRQRRKDKLKKIRDDFKSQLKAELGSAPPSLLDEENATRLEYEFNDRLTNLITDTDLTNHISETELDKIVENKLRFESRMKQYLYRHARAAGMTEQEKKESNRLAHIRTLAKQLRESPEEREHRLRKQREKYRRSMSQKTHEEILKYRRMITRHHQKNKDKILQSQIKYADLSEEKKERVRAIQRERLKQETLEQRQKRLARYKRNQEKNIQLRKLQKEQGISQEEADVLLRVTRPDLYPDPTTNFKIGPPTGKAYVPRPHMYLKAKGRPRLREQHILTFVAPQDEPDKNHDDITPTPNELLINAPESLSESGCDLSGEAHDLTSQVSTVSFPVTETVEVVLEGNEIQLVPILMLATSSVDLEEVPSVFGTEEPIFSPLVMSPQALDEHDLSMNSVDEIVNEIEIRDEREMDGGLGDLTIHQDKIEESIVPPIDSALSIPLSSPEPRPKKSLGGYRGNTPKVTEPRYVCELCGKQYYNQSYFNIHVESAHQLETRQFACPDVYCNKIFLHSFHLWKHYDTVHGSGRSLRILDPSRKASTSVTLSTICPYCSKNLASHRSVIRHIHDVHSSETGLKAEDIKFMCEQCPKKFKQKCTLDEHIRRVHLGINNKCDVCDRVFQSGVKLWKHKVDAHNMTNLDPSTVANVTQQECPYCQQKMFRGMKAHVLADHPEQADFYLSHVQSEEVVKVREARKKEAGRASYHEKYRPSLRKIVTCAVCNQSFTRQYNLNVHVARCHSGDGNKTFPCDKCQEKFINVKGLLKHIMVHHSKTFQERGIFFSMNQSDKSKVCKFCSQVLADHNVYKMHIVSQHAEQFLNYFRESLELEKALPRCQFCGVRQKTETGIKRHIRINHAEIAGLNKTSKPRLRKKRKGQNLKENDSETSPKESKKNTSEGQIVNDHLVRKSSRVKKSRSGFDEDAYQSGHQSTETEFSPNKRKGKSHAISDLETTKNEVDALLTWNDKEIIRQYYPSDALLNCLPIVELNLIDPFLSG